MRRLRAFGARIAALFGAARRDREIDDELNAHVEMMVSEYRRAGLDDEEARRAAGAKFGSVASAGEAYRDRRGFPFLEHCARDCGYAVRSLSRSPLLALSVVLVLGLGIGICTAIATIVHASLWRPLSVPDPDRVVKMSIELAGEFSRGVRGHASRFSYPEVATYTSTTRALTGVAALVQEPASWRGDGEPRSLSAALVTGNYFDVLRVRPALGRLLIESDARQPVVVISYRLWTDAFGRAPDALGATMNIDRTPYTVVGVAEPRFSGTEFAAAEVWLPLEMASTRRGNAALLADPNVSWLQTVGRLAPGESVASATAEAAVLAARLDAAHPGRRATVFVTRASRLDSGLLHATGRDSGKILIVQSAVTLVVALLLFICASNAASLLLARGAARHKEIGIRIALGASRGRIVQQLVVEHLLVAGSAAVVGLLICTWSLRALAHRLPLREVLETFTPDLPVLVFAMLAALVATLFFGVGPALQAVRVDPVRALKGEATTAGAVMPAARLRHWLVTAQITVSLILLVVSAVLARGIEHALRADPGFVTTDLYMVTLDVGAGGAEATPRHRGSLVRQLHDRLVGEPSVLAAGFGRILPFSGLGFTSARSEQMPLSVPVHVNAVDAGFFRALGITPSAGRLFDPGVNAGAVLVNASLARAFWRDERQAIGKVLQFPVGEGEAMRSATVIGVIPSIQSADVGVADEPTFYLPLDDDDESGASLVIRASAHTPIHRLVRQELTLLDRDAIAGVVSVEERIAARTAPARVGAAVAGLIGAFALLVAAVGIHGLVAYAVACRTHEIGVHFALGAPRARVLRLVIGSSLRAVLRGAMIGGLLVVAPATLLSGSIAPLLLGLSPLDPIACLAAVAVLAGVTLVAAYLPARRALGIAPITALRRDG